jgi:uncharacterized protein (DUF1330 family)
MSAYVIAQATIKNPEKLQEYGANAGPSIKAAGGELVSAARVTEVLAGSYDYERAVIIRFEDADAALPDVVVESAKAIRAEAMDAVFILAEDPPA